MKKSELRTGMIVETLNKKRFYVSLNGIDGKSNLISTNNTSYMPYKNIAEDLTAYSSNASNIIKVFIPKIIELTTDINKCELIWERKEKVKEYTMNELIKKVGHEFKIKK